MTAPRLQPEFTQQDRLLRLHTCLGEEVLLAEYLSGWEALEQGGFSLQLSALSSDATLTLQKIAGSPVLLELLCDDSRTYNQEGLSEEADVQLFARQAMSITPKSINTPRCRRA